jgi:hypothetical protein
MKLQNENPAGLAAERGLEKTHSKPHSSTFGPLVGFWELSERELLRLTWREVDGETRLDLRVWFRIEGGEYQPSHRGVSLPPAIVGELIDALIEAQALVERE